jgi:hypothetical protein
MIPAALPHDYVRYIDRGDRIRRSRIRPNGSRVRRGHAGHDDTTETA